MPKLLSQFKHEELELNSSLQIRSQKEIRAKSEKNGTLQEFCMVPRISQPTEFHRLRNFVTCETAKPLATIHPLGTVQVSSTVPSAHLSSSLFVLFFVFFLLSPCNSVWICCFW